MKTNRNPINGCEYVKKQWICGCCFFYPSLKEEWRRVRKSGWQKPQDRGCCLRFLAPPTHWNATVTLRFRDKSRFGTDLGLWLWLKTMFFFVTQVWWISQGWKSQKMRPGINHAPAFCFWSKWALHSRIDSFSAQCTNAEEELAKHPQQSISMNY